MDYSALIGAVAGAAVLLFGKAIDWFRARSTSQLEAKKQEADDKLREERQKVETSIPLNDQAVGILKDIVASLRADIIKLVENQHYQDKMLLECREDKITIKVQAEAAKLEIESLRKKVADYEGHKP